MRGSLLTLTLLAVFISASTPHAQDGSLRLGRNNVKEVIAAMTPEEKVRLLVGMGASFGDESQQSEEDRKTPEKVPGAAGRTHAIPRLGIPSLTLSDGATGVRMDTTPKTT